MLGVVLVLMGFAWGVLHDLAALRQVPRVKPILLAMAIASHLAGAYLLLARSPRTYIPRPLRRLSLVVAVITFCGMVYSIAVEIPFRRAWLDRGHTEDLVTSGTYSLSRHPGVLWTSIWIPCAAIASGSRDLLRSWALLLAADVLHVLIQDRLILPSVFGQAYRGYQHDVPFLVPRWSRLRQLVRSTPSGDEHPGGPPRSSTPLDRHGRRALRRIRLLQP